MASDVDMSIWDLNDTSVLNRTNKIKADEIPLEGTSKAEIYFLMVMLIICAVVGSLGNTFVLYGFSKMLRQNLTSTVFILTLAGTDLLTCLVIIPFTAYMEFVVFEGSPDLVCKVYHFLITSTVPYSIFMMVAIAVDRYLCICRPFLHFMNLRRAKIVVIVLAFLAILLGTFISMFYGVYEMITKTVTGSLNDTFQDWNLTVANFTAIEYNTSVVVYRGLCDINNLIFTSEFQRVLKYLHSSLFVVAVVVVGVLYGCIFRAVTKRRRKTQKIRSSNSVVYNNCNGNSSRRGSVFTQLTQRKRRSSTQESTKRNSRRSERAFIANLRTALTLFIVTVAFIILFLPGWTMALGLIEFRLTLFYLHLLHNAINPFIYAFMNETFRRVLQKLFSCSPSPVHKTALGGMSQTTC